MRYDAHARARVHAQHILRSTRVQVRGCVLLMCSVCVIFFLLMLPRFTQRRVWAVSCVVWSRGSVHS